MTSRLYIDRLFYSVSFFLFMMGFGWASTQIPAFPQKQPVALSNACIHPVSGEVIPKGMILFENGKITGVGKSISVPSGTRLVDVAGRCVYPGFIAVNTQVGLMEIEQESITHDISENPAFNPEIQTEMAVNPDSELIPVTRSNGIALALVSPVGNLIKGMSSLIQMDGWTNEDMKFKTRAALHIKWPSMRINREKASESKESRDKQIKIIKDAFAQAKAYWKAKETAKKENREIPKTDIRCESMKPVLEKVIPVVVEANSVDEIQAAVTWAEEEGVRIIIENGHDAVQIADWLKEKHIPVILQGVFSVELREQESYDYLYSLPAQLAEKGVQFLYWHGFRFAILPDAESAIFGGNRNRLWIIKRRSHKSPYLISCTDSWY